MVKRHHHVETLDMLRDLHAVGPVDVRRIDNFINRATMGEVSSCQVGMNPVPFSSVYRDGIGEALVRTRFRLQCAQGRNW